MTTYSFTSVPTSHTGYGNDERGISWRRKAIIKLQPLSIRGKNILFVHDFKPGRMSLSTQGTAGNVSAQASAELSSSQVSGSEVGVLAQVIIAIGVIPIEIAIAVIVLGVHRLVNRRSPQYTGTRTSIEKSSPDSLPYLQPKAELEDVQRRRHELHGENFAYELNGEGEILQMPDGTESLVLPVQRRQGIQEMPEGNPMSWELPLHERHEVIGDEHAQELESPTQNKHGSVKLVHLHELESPVEARDEPAKVHDAQGLDSPVHDPAPDQHKNPMRNDLIQSHFMLRQQQILHPGGSAAIEKT